MNRIQYLVVLAILLLAAYAALWPFLPFSARELTPSLGLSVDVDNVRRFAEREPACGVASVIAPTDDDSVFLVTCTSSDDRSFLMKVALMPASKGED